MVRDDVAPSPGRTRTLLRVRARERRRRTAAPRPLLGGGDPCIDPKVAEPWHSCGRRKLADRLRRHVEHLGLSAEVVRRVRLEQPIRVNRTCCFNEHHVLDLQRPRSVVK